MKFWEALKEMEAGAVCIPAEIANGDRHRIINGRLEVWDRGNRDWINSPAIVNGCIGDWRIVTPAPSEAKEWTNTEDIVFKSPDDVVTVDVHGTKVYLSLRPTDPSEAKPEPHADACKGDTFGYVQSAQHPRLGYIDALSKRVEELERLNRAQNILNGLNDSNARLSALEAKIAALEASTKDAVAKGVQECAAKIMLADAQIRYDREQIEWAKRQGLKPEGTVAAIENVTDSPKDLGFKPNHPAIPDSSPIAWPKGSLQWAEVEARRRGMNHIRRPNHLAYCNVGIVFFAGEESRHALDWEPCE